MKPLDPFAKLEILRRHLDGDPAESIAESLGVPLDAVRELIADAPARPKEPAPAPKRGTGDPRFAWLERMRIPAGSRPIEHNWRPTRSSGTGNPDLDRAIAGCKVITHR